MWQDASAVGAKEDSPARERWVRVSKARSAVGTAEFQAFQYSYAIPLRDLGFLFTPAQRENPTQAKEAWVGHPADSESHGGKTVTVTFKASRRWQPDPSEPTQGQREPCAPESRAFSTTPVRHAEFAPGELLDLWRRLASLRAPSRRSNALR